MRPINLKLAAAICAAGFFFVTPKGFCDEQQEPIFSLGMSSGVFQIDYSHVSATDMISGSTIASDPTVGADILMTMPLLILPKELPFGLAVQAGYNYNLPTNDLAVSYFFANILLKNDMSLDMNGYLGAGAVYSSWNQGIAGGLGWQLIAGTMNSDGIYIGLRYLSVPGSRSTGGYQSTFLLSQLIFDLQYHF